MAKKLSTMRKKRRADQRAANRRGKLPKRHKVAVERSKKAKRKNSYRMT